MSVVVLEVTCSKVQAGCMGHIMALLLPTFGTKVFLPGLGYLLTSSEGPEKVITSLRT